MLVLKTFKLSLKPLTFVFLLFFFSLFSIIPTFILSFNFSGEKVDPFNFYLNFLKNKNFFGEGLDLIGLFDFKDFRISSFFDSQLNLIFFITFISIFVFYHFFLPLIYKSIKGEKISFVWNSSFLVLIFGFIQLIIYFIFFYIYLYFSGQLKNYTDTLLLETYKIVLTSLFNLFFILFLLIFRYFFAFLKIFLSFENFSFSVLKNSLILSFKNYLKLIIFHLILFLIHYLFLNLLGGNILNVFIKTYLFLFLLSYYLTLKEAK